MTPEGPQEQAASPTVNYQRIPLLRKCVPEPLLRYGPMGTVIRLIELAVPVCMDRWNEASDAGSLATIHVAVTI